MRVAFCVDALEKIETGHMMRRLTMADALNKHEATFDLSARHLWKMLAIRGYQVVGLPSKLSKLTRGGLVHALWLDTAREKGQQ